MDQEVIAGKRILLVEDDFLISMDMSHALLEMGAAHIETAPSVEHGVRKAEHEDFDFAILDMNLRGEVSFAIAKKIKDRNLPFVFVTGYGGSVDLPPELTGTRVLTKPVNFDALAEALKEIDYARLPTREPTHAQVASR